MQQAAPMWQRIVGATGAAMLAVTLMAGAAEAAVPGSVQSLVQARMDQLDPFDRQALQTAAIFGQRFALDALRHALQSPDYDCAALVEHFLVRRIGDEFVRRGGCESDDDWWAFMTDVTGVPRPEAPA